MLRVVLVHTSSRFSLDFVVLNLVPRPPFDEEIRVRDFVMLACSLSISCKRVVVSNYPSCEYQGSVSQP